MTVDDAGRASGPRAQSDELPPRPEPPLDVAVSACLLGEPVRYDGGHKRSSLPHERLAGLFELHGICPELAIGLGAPRDPIRLVGPIGAPRAVGVVDPRIDVTERLRAFAGEARVLERVAGVVLMTGSPSCGLVGVKIYSDADAAPVPDGRGVFAAEVARLHPALPVEDCTRLFEPAWLDSFASRVFAYAHWRSVCAAGLSARRVIAFHSAYKYLLMAHSVAHYREAGRLLADLSGELPAVAARYAAVLMAGLARPATVAGHANVLMHLQGHLKRALDAPTRRALAAAIDGYRRGETALDAPLEAFRELLRRYPDPYVVDQVYLNPHPSAAGLRRQRAAVRTAPGPAGPIH